VNAVMNLRVIYCAVKFSMVKCVVNSEEGMCSMVVKVRLKSFLHSLLQLLVTANMVIRLLILVTLILEVISSSETSVLTRATRRNIQTHVIGYSQRRENLKSDIALTGWAL
jgi:hypothetical protein